MKPSFKSILTVVVFYFGFSNLYAQDFSAVKAIASRRTPWLAAKLEFASIKDDNGKDVFELSSNGKSVIISASNVNAASQGLGWFLKYYCHRSLSHMGDNLAPIEKLPVISQKVRIVSPYRFRYALNYCTINYSMSFYKWEDWEKELDWMALNGVNLMLAPVGVEAVWQNTLVKLGYNRTEIQKFIPGPAFTAWWLMGNLEGWGGPVSQSFINQQVKLEKDILKRMAGLGIAPLMHGFYGMIPTTLKEKIKIDVIPQGKWAGGFQRPDFLKPTDPWFKKIAAIYYQETKKLYGPNLKFFGGDPFHEGGSSNGLDVTSAAKTIQEAMQFSYPNSTWVLQGWGSNPSTKLLAGLNKQNTLVVELFGENTSNYLKTKAYDGTPFIWSNVSNFGEKIAIYGKLERFANEVDHAKKGEYGKYLAGIGIIPEGIINNPVAYDLMLELGWHQNKVDVSNWLKTYAKYRYGKTNENIDTAWQLFLKTAYNDPKVDQEGPSESIFCARPAVGMASVSTWGTLTRNYDTALFKKGVQYFVKSINDFKNNETYRMDLIDFVRQVLANKSLDLYQEINKNIQDKNATALKANANKFCKMLLQQDSLLANNRIFTINRWLNQAVNFQTDKADVKNALRNAKIQISYWGPDNNVATNLRDYANKEWNGILGSLYLNRWQQFFDYKLATLAGKTVQQPNYYQMEKDWSELNDLYAPVKLSDQDFNHLVNEILR